MTSITPYPLDKCIHPLFFLFSRESESEDEDTGKPLTTDELRTRAMKGVSGHHRI